MHLKTLRPYFIVGIILASIISVVSLSVKIDSTSPILTITSPTSSQTYVTNDEEITIGGMVYDDIGIAGINWSNINSKESGGIPGITSSSENWNISGIVLIEGKNLITIRAWDAAGNSNVQSIYVILDTVNPYCTILIPTRDSKFATSASSINISGISSDKLGIVSVDWINGANNATGMATGANSWTINTLPLSAGYNEIQIRAWDAAGNCGEEIINISSDHKAPVCTIISPSSNPTYSTRWNYVNLAGISSDNLGVTRIQGTNAATGVTKIGNGTTDWNVTGISLKIGNNPITVTVWDASDNSGSDNITVIYDSIAPTCTITSPTSNPAYATSSTTINLGGSASDNNAVGVVTWKNMATGVYGTATGTTSWTINDIALNAGTNLIFVNASDDASNVISNAIYVNRDSIGPSCIITVPTSSPTYLTDWMSVNLNGTASDNVEVTSVNWSNSLGGSGTTYMNPKWGGASISWQSKGNVQLFSGVNVITVAAHDAAGNIGTDILTITYENVTPVVNITSPTASATYPTNSATINLGGSASDASGIATVTWKNMATGVYGTATGTTSWTITGIALNAGNNLIYVNATDNAGNKASDAIFVNRDSTNPTCTISNPTSSPTMTTGWHYISLNGTATDNIKVTSVNWSNSLGGSGTTYMTPQFGGASISWQSISNVHLLPGDNVITVTAYDWTGNSMIDVLTVTYTGL